jgi:hypothetical protein
MGPHPSAISPAFAEEITSAAYSSDASDLLAMGVDAWIYGHTHDTRDEMIGNARLITNAKGYGPWPPKELTWDNPNFDPHFVIEI